MPASGHAPLVTNLDDLCTAAVDRSVNMLIPWLLIASYAYYHEDESLLSDLLFDRMCKQALERYAEITHPHKRFVSEDALRAGSLYHLRREDYPSVVEGACRRLVGDLRSRGDTLTDGDVC